MPLSHLDENTLVENSLKNSLVFGSHSLEGLLIRVRELHTEGNRQMRVHHQNVHHLRRLHVDSIVLHHKLKSLNDQICSAMQRKFGDVIPLREIEEKTLSQTVFKLRTALGMIDPQASQIFQVNVNLYKSYFNPHYNYFRIKGKIYKNEGEIVSNDTRAFPQIECVRCFGE